MPSLLTRPATTPTTSQDARELERAIHALERAHRLYLSRRDRLHGLTRARRLLRLRRARLEYLLDRHAPTVHHLTDATHAE